MHNSKGVLEQEIGKYIECDQINKSLYTSFYSFTAFLGLPYTARIETSWLPYSGGAALALIKEGDISLHVKVLSSKQSLS